MSTDARARPPWITKERGRRLTSQQRRCVALIAEGMTNKEIARALGLAADTVKNQLGVAFVKLGIERRSQAAVLYVQGKIGAP